MIIGNKQAVENAGCSGVFNCQFIEIASDFKTSHAVQSPRVEGCCFDGVDVGIYLEMQRVSFDPETLVFRNNIVIPTKTNDGSIGIAVSSQVPSGIRSAFVVGNEIRFKGGGEGSNRSTAPRGFSFNRVKRLVLTNNMVTMYRNAPKKEIEMANVSDYVMSGNYRSDGNLIRP